MANLNESLAQLPQTNAHRVWVMSFAKAMLEHAGGAQRHLLIMNTVPTHLMGELPRNTIPTHLSVLYVASDRSPRQGPPLSSCDLVAYRLHEIMNLNANRIVENQVKRGRTNHWEVAAVRLFNYFVHKPFVDEASYYHELPQSLPPGMLHNWYLMHFIESEIHSKMELLRLMDSLTQNPHTRPFRLLAQVTDEALGIILTIRPDTVQQILINNARSGVWEQDRVEFAEAIDLEEERFYSPDPLLDYLLARDRLA